MSGVGINLSVSGRRAHVAIKQKVFGVTDEIIHRNVQVVVKQAQVETDICLCIRFPFQVGVDFFQLGEADYLVIVGR